MPVSRDLSHIYEKFRSCFVCRADDFVPYYRAARCVFAPIVSGPGISIKTVHSLALGQPFIGASKAFRGMPVHRVESARPRMHDDPKAFADAIVRALDPNQTAGALSRAAYDELFSLKTAFASRDEAVRIAMCGRS
jgi:Glycosyl transferases group 1